MNLIRCNPMRDLAEFPGIRNFGREIDRLFGGIDFPSDFFQSGWVPAMDVEEHDDRYEVKLEIPGVSRDDVKITLENDTLVIKGEKRQENEKKERRSVERSYGSFSRSLTLPAHIRSEKAEASFKEGVLTVTLPKTEEVKPKTIEVNVK